MKVVSKVLQIIELFGVNKGELWIALQIITLQLLIKIFKNKSNLFASEFLLNFFYYIQGMFDTCTCVCVYNTNC